MKYRKRRFFTQADKTLMWDRWQKGESLNTIARLLGTRLTVTVVTNRIEPTKLSKLPEIGRTAPRPVNWPRTRRWR